MQKIFSTGDVAVICKVAPRTVSQWFDSGKLRGYRVPGSLIRRIPRDSLVSFLETYGGKELLDEYDARVASGGT